MPAEGNSIVRVEILNGAFLYAIRNFLQGEEFNLRPADHCRLSEGEGGTNGVGLTDGVSGRGLSIAGYLPPAQVIEDVRRITAAEAIEVGGVEYLVNSRDGQVYYYDINALSNFVANAPDIIGFDPSPRLVDFLLVRARLVCSRAE